MPRHSRVEPGVVRGGLLTALVVTALVVGALGSIITDHLWTALASAWLAAFVAWLATD